MIGKRTAAIVWRQFYLMRGSLSRILPLFAWVGVDMILWGFLTKYLNSVSSAQTNFVSTLLGTVLLWDFFIRVMQGVTIAFFEDVWTRNFLNLFATPLSIFEYLWGLVLTSLATSCVGLIFMIVLAAGIFGLSYGIYGILLLPFLLILFLFGISLGIFASAMVLRMGPAFEWFVWPMPALISPFVGVFYPVSTLPGWMQAIAQILPPSYVFEGMRAIIFGGTFSGGMLWPAAGLTALYLLVAFWFFQTTFQHAMRTGLIARYSAESVS